MRVLLAAMFSLLVLPSSAQDPGTTCDRVKSYLASPPSRFIADRGKNFDDIYWESKSSPNLCKIFHVSSGAQIHQAICDISVGETPAATSGIHERLIDTIRKCIATLPDGSQYTESTTNDDAGRLVGWEKKKGKEVFRIQAGANLKPDNRAVRISVGYELHR